MNPCTFSPVLNLIVASLIGNVKLGVITDVLKLLKATLKLYRGGYYLIAILSISNDLFTLIGFVLGVICL